MKTTIDIPEEVYRSVKAKSAMEGRPVRDVAIMLFSAWVNQPDASSVHTRQKEGAVKDQEMPAWFGSLRKYARNARSQYSMGAIRRNIARGRAGEEQS